MFKQFRIKQQLGVSTTLTIVVISVVITAIIVGGGVFAYGQIKLSQTQNDTLVQISKLNKQVVELQNKIDNTVGLSDVIYNKDTESTIKQDISEWKKYTNDKFGFSFLYPNTWSLDSVVAPTIVSVVEEAGWGGSSGGIYVQTVEKTSIENALQKAKKEAEQKPIIGTDNASAYPQYGPPEVVKVGGVSAIKRRYQTYEIVPSGYDFIVPIKGISIGLSELKSSQTPEQLDNTLQLILSTFIFSN